MKRPLVAVVSCYTIGLLLGEAFQPPLMALFVVAFVVLVLVLALEKIRPFLIWPLLLLAGWINLTSRITIMSEEDLRALDRQRRHHCHSAGDFDRNAAPENRRA